MTDFRDINAGMIDDFMASGPAALADRMEHDELARLAYYALAALKRCRWAAGIVGDVSTESLAMAQNRDAELGAAEDTIERLKEQRDRLAAANRRVSIRAQTLEKRAQFAEKQITALRAERGTMENAHMALLEFLEARTSSLSKFTDAKRYRPDGDGWVEENESGNWVEYTEHRNIVNELAHTIAELHAQLEEWESGEVGRHTC